MQPFGNHQVTTLVPARLIHHQKQVFVWPYLLFLGEGAQGQRKGLSIDGGHEQPTGLSALWRNIPIEIHPLIARSDHRPHSGPLSGPDAAQDRFETDAVLILAPQFNAGLWIRLMQRLDLLWEFF